MFDLLCLGLGIVIGSGWTQLTGSTAQQYSGSAVFLSYVFAGLSALLAAACYAELCLEYPVSGGAFSYVMVTFGEFAAFVTLASLLLEYALGMAAVARGFSSNLASLVNLQPRDIRMTLWEGGEEAHTFDLVAAGIVLFMSLLLSLGVRESAHFISGMTVIKLALLLAVSIVGYTRGAWPNPNPGTPGPSHFNPFTKPQWDADGIFVGAAMLFFAFTGIDAVGNAAEEVKDVRHLPAAILGTVGVACLMYVMLALALAVLAYPNISCPADALIPPFPPPLVNFISAFVGGHGLKCMQYVTSLAALAGIMTSLTVGLFSVSRIAMVAARDWMLPPFLAKVSRRTQTPLIAQMTFGVIIALLAMMVEVDASTALVSFGTLVVLWLVCNAQIYRRYFPDTQMRFTRYGTVETAPKQDLHSWAPGRRLSLRVRRWLVWGHMLAINGVCLALAIYYAETTAAPVGGTTNSCSAQDKNIHHSGAVLWLLLAWFLVTLSFQLCCPLEYQPAGWHVPWWAMPWLPSAAILLVLFSIGALPDSDFWKVGVYFLIVLGVYLLFSLPMSYIKHSRVDYVNTEELKVVELVYGANGRLQPARLPPGRTTPVAPAVVVHSSSTELAVKAPSGSVPSITGKLSGVGSGGAMHPGGSAAVAAAAAAAAAGRHGSGGSGQHAARPACSRLDPRRNRRRSLHGVAMISSAERKAFARDYFSALLQLPQLFRRLAFRRRTLEEELNEALLRGSLRKAFGMFDLLCLGLGIVIGSGWGQLSGAAAELYAGPAVILSYLFSGVAALLTAACFAELCLEYPVSGGAFSYVMVTFGEFAAFLALAGLLLEYALGMAAVARGFSRYLARLCNAEPSLFVLEVGANNQHTVDFMAAGIVLVMSLLLSLGVRESAAFISGVTVFKVVLIVFISIVGYTQGTFSTYNPPYAYSFGATVDPALSPLMKGPGEPFFHPFYGADGVFLGAAMLFFTYVGFDAICNAAEEARNVAHMPMALLGTAGASMTLYMLLSLSLVLTTTPNVINADIPADNSMPNKEDEQLSFITAFVYCQGMKWMQYFVSVALLCGTVTGLTVGLFSASRIIMAAARDWMLPPCLAKISRRTQTPLVAQMTLGVIIAVMAMVVEVQFATGMVSFGMLVSLWLVCNAQLFRRYSPDVQMRFTRYGTVEIAPREDLKSWALGRRLSLPARRMLLWAHLLALNGVCIALCVYYTVTTNDTPDTANRAGMEELGHSSLATLWFAIAWVVVTLSLQVCCPLEYQPAGWHVPWWAMPWLPSAAIVMVLFSVGALPNSDLPKVGIYFAVALSFYVLFSLPMSYIKLSRGDYVNTEELNVVELVYINGRLQPRRAGVGPTPHPPHVLCRRPAACSELRVRCV
ncbi:cationic amino acid transporter 1-like [Micractinium conductrix]|uniref:Cationic amino acid transporter 1-like n=1 Tax=Micractinium conductrix TaxID=554055 RepID=A0A2P6V2N9_9CHLO|nr:cationic amino acid transporter 1-like [Micractinium conductrix]|eukprot:PSC68357.1 cationic amino acid transporter 1-like [Micractinium conductrix]